MKSGCLRGPSCPANDYFASCAQTSGRTDVPSAFTASSAVGYQSQRHHDRRRDLCGCRGGRDGLCGKAGIGYQQHDIGIVMREPAVISHHRRAARIGHAHVRRHNNVRRPRNLTRLKTANVVVQRQGRPVSKSPEPDRCCLGRAGRNRTPFPNRIANRSPCGPRIHAPNNDVSMEVIAGITARNKGSWPPDEGPTACRPRAIRVDCGHFQGETPAP